MEKQFIPFEYVDIIMIVSTPFLALDMLIRTHVGNCLTRLVCFVGSLETKCLDSEWFIVEKQGKRGWKIRSDILLAYHYTLVYPECKECINEFITLYHQIVPQFGFFSVWPLSLFLPRIINLVSSLGWLVCSPRTFRSEHSHQSVNWF